MTDNCKQIRIIYIFRLLFVIKNEEVMFMGQIFILKFIICKKL